METIEVNVLKQGTLLLIGSVLCITFIMQFSVFLQGMEHAHDILTNKMSTIFAGSIAGLYVKETLALIIIPSLIGFIPAAIYWTIKRKTVPYLMTIIWIAWLMLATTLAVHGRSIDQQLSQATSTQQKAFNEYSEDKIPYDIT